MSIFAITAVDNATDTLEIIGHGLNTGDGQAGIRAKFPGALPTGYASSAIYWIIRVDADHVKLASSSANALAGTAVAISDDGSGDLVLEVGIPYRRSTTYVPNSGPPGSPTPGSQVKSADLNALEDANVALHARLTGQAQSIWPVEEIPIIIPGARAVDGTNVHAALLENNLRIGYTWGASSAPLTFPIDGLCPGDIITRWEVMIEKISSGGAAAYSGVIRSYDFLSKTAADESAGSGVVGGGIAEPNFEVGETGIAVVVDDADPSGTRKQYYIRLTGTASCENDHVYHGYVWVKRARLGA